MYSDLCRSIATNRSQSRSRQKRPKQTNDPSTVTPLQRSKEFCEEKLTVSAGKLFCLACMEELSLKKSIIINHVSSSKQTLGKEKLAGKEKHEVDIAEALKKYNDSEHPSGESLPQSVRVFRVKVLCTFLKAGVAISKIKKFLGKFSRRMVYV